jgi:hypothetical protein
LPNIREEVAIGGKAGRESVHQGANFAFKFNSLSLEQFCPHKYPRSVAPDFRGAVAKILWPNRTPQRAIHYTHHTCRASQTLIDEPTGITELPGCYDEATLEV